MSWRDADVAMRSNIEGMTASAKVLWFVLAMHRNGESGRCDPGHETLMRETCLKKWALKEARDLLKQLGVIDFTLGNSTRRDGKVSTKYHLLIRDGYGDQPRTFQDDYQGDDDRVADQPGTGLVTNPVVVENVASTGLVTNPKSGVTVFPKGPLDDSTVNGYRSTADNLVHSTQDTPPEGTPDKTTAKASGEQSPDPSDEDDDPEHNSVCYVRDFWKYLTKKPYRDTDFLRLIRQRHDLGDNDVLNIDDVMIWMFRDSHWASESANWKGPFDIFSSGVFVKHYQKILDQAILYRAKQTIPDEETLPPASDDEVKFSTKGFEIDDDQDWGDEKELRKQCLTTNDDSDCEEL